MHSPTPVRLPIMLAFTFLLSFASSARADYTIDPDEPPGLKSEGTAMALSIGVTAGSIGLLFVPKVGVVGAVGLYFGPSLAQFYASDRPMARGFMLRTTGIVAIAAGLNMRGVCFSGCDPESDTAANAVITAGALAIVAGIFDDIARQSELVHRHNARIRAVSLSPTLTSDGAGLALSGRF
jgi:hypothetical protein